MNTAKLSEAFFQQLQRHPVPLEEAAIRQLSNNSMALDAYAWLAYRLHILSGPVIITWRSLFTQFGGGFAQVKHFKPRFLANLGLATAVYPDARIDVDDTKGITLHSSKPPVDRKHTLR